jgi:mannose-1-phosphate guanylyltransferase/mannose-6-phosphate isomerase
MYLLEGCYYWNSGMFIWKASQILAEIKRYMPDLYRGIEGLKMCLERGDKKGIEDIYRQLRAISIDYGVMEKSENVVLIPTDMGWSDVGSWIALEDIMEKDKEGNIAIGDCLLVDTTSSIFWGGRRLIAAVGLRDKIVVDTQDALLVCEKDRSQDVNRVVEILRARGREESFYTKEGVESWGRWTVLEKKAGYLVVSLEIYPESTIEPHEHKGIDEHLIVTQGCASVLISGNGQDLYEGKGIFISRGIQHKIENRAKQTLRIIEIHTGDLNTDNYIFSRRWRD